MARRTVYDCDGCDMKDVGDGAELCLYEPRQAGEMDGGSVAVSLCPKCLRRFVYAVVKGQHYTAPDVLRIVKAGK